MKELWLDFYEQRLNEGMSQGQATMQADEDCANYLAYQADYAKDREIDKYLEDMR